jgi:hypothetical protein
MLYHYTVVLKEWCDVARDVLCRTTLSWHHIIGMGGKTHLCKQRKHSDCLMFIHSYYVSQIHCHVIFSKDMVSIFPVHISPNKKALLDDCTVTLKVIEQQRDIGEWTATNNVTSCTKCSLPQSFVQIC